jgi:feruloyl esterase
MAFGIANRNSLGRVVVATTVVVGSLSASLGCCHADAGNCDRLMGYRAVENTTVESATMVNADGDKKLPAFCEVKVLIQPVPQSHIQAVYRMPENWNGKFLGVGGGGFAGDMTLATAAAGLSKGYAVAGTDTGHPTTNSTDGSFMIDGPGHVDPVQLADFGYRAVHLMTTVGKLMVREYYGKNTSRAYFQGCSTGGRQGFAEVQRFPEDYDGVISGAPVYDFRVQTSGIFRLQAFHQKSESLITVQQLEAVHRAVLDACDASDGVRDGIVADPLACKWDPSELACKAGDSKATCLTPEQVDAIRRSYDGVKSTDGQVAAWPLMRGGELAWQARSLGGTADNPLGQNYALTVRYLMTFVYGNPDHPWKTMTPDEIVRDVDASPVLKPFQVNDPDASAFIKRGGKWLIWHGLQDPGPSPLGTLEYFEAAKAATAKALDGNSDLDGKMRFFLAPGVYHCRGGPGPDQFDMLTSIDNWVEKGEAPDRIIATKTGSNLSRPLCPFPKAARYSGSGDTDAAASFVCR